MRAFKIIQIVRYDVFKPQATFINFLSADTKTKRNWTQASHLYRSESHLQVGKCLV